MDIALEPKDFEQAKSGAITGPIWLRHQGVEFPERGWSDFPVVILGWWLKHVADLARGAKSALCSFMDGPFEFSVTSEVPGICRLQLARRGVEAKSVVSEFTVDAITLHASLHTAAATVLAECDRRGWAGRDIEDLRASARAGRH